MLDGCRAWQEGGLQPPAAVTNATDRYMEAQDALGAWLEECCDLASTFKERATILYGSWKAWCDRNGEEAGSQKTFGLMLEQRGFSRFRTKITRGYEGVRIKPEEVPPAPYADR
jgi:phage/plasmid-associated DNA primase